MFGYLNYLASEAAKRQAALKIAGERARLVSEQERFLHLADLERWAAREIINGRRFKCGPWSWRFVTHIPGNVERIR